MNDPESRLARVEERTVELQAEVQRNRARIHDLESGRIAIALLTEKIAVLAEETRRLSEQMHSIALRAAQEAVDIALSMREEMSVKRRGIQLQSVVTGAAIATIIISIIFHFA